MDKLKQVMPVVFINVASLLLLGLVVVAVASLPFLKGSELILGVIAGAYGFDRVKALVSKLPGLNQE